MPRPDVLSTDYSLCCHGWLHSAECSCLRAVLLAGCESLMPCCSCFLPDIAFRLPSPRSASQTCPDHRCTLHLPPHSSHNSVILPSQTYFLHICVSVSNTEQVLSYQGEGGKEGMREGMKEERKKGREKKRKEERKGL